MKHSITKCGVGLMSAAFICWSAIGLASAQALDKYWTLTGIPEGETLEGRGQLPGGREVTVYIPAGMSGLVGSRCGLVLSLSADPNTWCDVLFKDLQGQVDHRLLTSAADAGLPVYAPPRDPGRRKDRGGYVPKLSAIGVPPLCKRVSEMDAKTLELHCDWPRTPAP